MSSLKAGRRVGRFWMLLLLLAGVMFFTSTPSHAQEPPAPPPVPDVNPPTFPPGSDTEVVGTEVAPPPAEAVEALYPANCLGWASVFWKANCWLGRDGSRFDNRGNTTRATQLIVNCSGFNGGTVDGIFGYQTERGVAAYQASRGLSSDGIVGARTWSKLQSELGNPSQYQGYTYYMVRGPCENYGYLFVFQPVQGVGGVWWVWHVPLNRYVPMDTNG